MRQQPIFVLPRQKIPSFPSADKNKDHTAVSRHVVLTSLLFPPAAQRLDFFGPPYTGLRSLSSS